MLCLNGRYRKTKKCGALDADGYAHHAYTTAKGPRFVPHDTRDVTLGVLSRLERALDRAGKAGALPRGLPVYLTEFGIQSRPDRIQGVSFAKQAAYLSIAEHMAYVNPRVRSFSQYLMSDDRAARVGAEQVRRLRERAAHEQGQEEARLQGVPAAARGRELRQHGRPLGARAPVPAGDRRVRIEVDPRGKKGWRKLADVKTTGTGVYSLRGDAPQGPALPRQVDLAGRQALHRRRRARLLTGLDIRRILAVRPIGV